MQDLRKALLEMAYDHFRTSGVGGLDMGLLAQEMNMTREALAELYPTQEDLVFDVFLHELDRMAKASMVGLPTGLRKQFRHLLECRYRFFAMHKASSRTVMLDTMLRGNRLRDEFDNLLWRFSVEIVSLIQAAERAGEIRDNVDEAVAARAFVAYYVMGMLTILRTENATVETVSDFIMPLVDALVDSMS
jgi:AcrR family transcriptional regulator